MLRSASHLSMQRRQAPKFSALGRLAKGVLPAALAALPVFDGIGGGYQSYKNGEGPLGVAAGTAEGLGKGAVETFLPGARNGYGDVTGGDRTMVDRFLNAASDATGTATAVGTTAMVLEGAGVVTIPSMIPTGAATLVAGVSNLGINAAKGALKVTGLAGADQDGGYIYDGARPPPAKSTIFWAGTMPRHLLPPEVLAPKAIPEPLPMLGLIPSIFCARVLPWPLGRTRQT